MDSHDHEPQVPTPRVVRAAVLVPWAIATAVTAKLWYFNFAVAGIANAALGTQILWTSDEWASRFAIIIADTWKTTPFMTLLLLAGLQLIPDELYEAAKVDGAGTWQRFTKITLPLLKPALVVAVLFRVLDTLRFYDLPAILTGEVVAALERHDDTLDPRRRPGAAGVQQRGRALDDHLPPRVRGRVSSRGTGPRR